MRVYFYTLLRKYLSIFILPQNSVVEIDPTSSLLIATLPNGKVSFRNTMKDSKLLATDICKEKIIPYENIHREKPDYIVISNLIHYERDIQGLLFDIHKLCHKDTRLLLTYYSALWRPLTYIASKLNLRSKVSELNWIGHEDIKNLLELESFELIRLDLRVLIPLYIPFISSFCNRFLAHLPFIKNFCLLNLAIARPLFPKEEKLFLNPSVSIVIPARNEEGNIINIIKRIPIMGPKDEIIFIEGNSTDNTWSTIQRAQETYKLDRRIVIAQQEGKGKGDAVRKGFDLASNEILMILDADITVPPEDLLKFYRAINDNKGEFINGSRLVYPMQEEAMQFLNLIGNKFFAMAFSYVLGQRFKDTLCGTKAITRLNYKKLSKNRSFFGEFDPFGDFDLIFGAARMGLKIIEIPICYAERSYGKTNISRWHHGTILLAMLIFSAKKIRFL